MDSVAAVMCLTTPQNTSFECLKKRLRVDEKCAYVGVLYVSVCFCGACAIFLLYFVFRLKMQTLAQGILGTQWDKANGGAAE